MRGDSNQDLAFYDAGIDQPMPVASEGSVKSSPAFRKLIAAKAHSKVPVEILAGKGTPVEGLIDPQACLAGLRALRTQNHHRTAQSL